MTEPPIESASTPQAWRSDLLVVIGSFAVYLCPVLSGIETVTLGRIAVGAIQAMLSSPQSTEQADLVMVDLGTALAAQGLFGFLLSWLLVRPNWPRVAGFVALLPLIVAGVNHAYFTGSSQVTDGEMQQKLAALESGPGNGRWRPKCILEEEALMPLAQPLDTGLEAAGKVWTSHYGGSEIGMFSMPGCRHVRFNVSTRESTVPVFATADGAALWRIGGGRLALSAPPDRSRLRLVPVKAEGDVTFARSLTVSGDVKYVGWIDHEATRDVAVLRELATGQEKRVITPRGFTTRLLAIDVGAGEIAVAQTQGDLNVISTLDLEGRVQGEPLELPVSDLATIRRVADGWVAWVAGPQQGTTVVWSLPSGEGKYEVAPGGRVGAVHPAGRWIGVIVDPPTAGADDRRYIRMVRTADGAEPFDIQLESRARDVVFVGGEYFAYQDGGSVIVLEIDED